MVTCSIDRAQPTEPPIFAPNLSAQSFLGKVGLDIQIPFCAHLSLFSPRQHSLLCTERFLLFNHREMHLFEEPS